MQQMSISESGDDGVLELHAETFSMPDSSENDQSEKLKFNLEKSFPTPVNLYKDGMEKLLKQHEADQAQKAKIQAKQKIEVEKKTWTETVKSEFPEFPLKMPKVETPGPSGYTIPKVVGPPKENPTPKLNFAPIPEVMPAVPVMPLTLPEVGEYPLTLYEIGPQKFLMERSRPKNALTHHYFFNVCLPRVTATFGKDREH